MVCSAFLLLNVWCQVTSALICSSLLPVDSIVVVTESIQPAAHTHDVIVTGRYAWHLSSKIWTPYFPLQFAAHLCSCVLVCK
jgi:hypothetical protein